MNPDSNALQLRDIHLPDAVPWWPLAPGWWLLIGLLALILLFIFVVRPWLRQRRNNIPLPKLAHSELDSIINQFKQHQDAQQLVQAISILLRRVSLSYLPRQQAASVTGDAWVQQLNQLVDETCFDDAIAKILQTAPYQPQCTIDSEQLIRTTQHWIQKLPRRPLP